MDREDFDIPIVVSQLIKSIPSSAKRAYMYIVLAIVISYVSKSSKQITLIIFVLATHEYLTYRMDVFLQEFSGIGENFLKQINYRGLFTPVWNMIPPSLIAGLNILIAAPMFVYGSYSDAYTEFAGLAIIIFSLFAIVILPTIRVLDLLIENSGLGVFMYFVPLFRACQIGMFLSISILYGVIAGNVIWWIYTSPTLILGENPPELLIYLSMASRIVAGLIVVLPVIQNHWEAIRQF